MPRTAELLKGRSILVVEDEMMVLMNIEDVLRDHACTEVVAAATIDQALALINARSFDAAILDVNLDGKPSHLVADELAAHDIPFVVSTGYGQLALGSSYGDRPVLMKPYRDETLVKMLAQLLGDAAAQ
ncbi:MAG: response regulator [Pseudomonadota bacterium]|nr:response regulator [Pseudomonadota bacterium]